MKETPENGTEFTKAEETLINIAGSSELKVVKNVTEV